ncbi:transglutaminase-like domain-containing protein [Gryllotalpicola protaetiae]|uniref:Transglutaminase domain-containing protein n=1 Tax=Gryllotalpicola protaetiae TaxID=2419771 RepID=A0A387BGG2_9MICO|nr:transglutaminase-like domain-containing protein [Gryllotalpicola protaetiae]AYG03013.1 transglutaminase domain-containing protein [Gryllotalpicola protaetiae]
MAARRRGRAAGPDAAMFVDLGFVLALVAVGAFAAWPIYQTWYLVVTVAGAVAIAAGAVLVGRLRGWSWALVSVCAAAAYVAFGVPLAIPSAFASRADFVGGYRDLVVATVGDWKKLITVDTPVGHFQTLLVPLLVTMLVCTTAAFSIVFSRSRSYGALVPIMLVPTAFAIVFGTTGPGTSLTIGSFRVAALTHTIVGVLALGAAGGFLVWRGQHARTVALREAAAASGIRRPGGTAVGSARRIAGAVAVALVGLAVAVPLSSTALEPSQRQVLRSAVDATAQLGRYTSPLTTYRAAFSSQPDTYNAPVIRYSGDAQQLGRLRVATMSFYNGQQYTVLPNDSDRSSAFAHKPQLTSSSRAQGLASLDLTIGSGFDAALGSGVWLPTVDGLTAISFGGSDVNALTDGFYYNDKLQAGAELHKLQAGDSYTLLAKPQSAAGQLGALSPPQGAVPATADIPDSLTQWVQSQNLGTGGQALTGLIQRLRDRGYLSHSLVKPTGTDTWLTDEGAGAEFHQSLAGESMDRIGALFDDLLRQQQEVGLDAAPADLVAGVGDDEQFAVASALIAESLGFPARVVLGFTLPGGDADAAAIPACSDGVCRGKNLTAWVEVQAADLTWVPLTTTPQSKLPLSEHQITTSVPKLPTQVQQHVATVQPPPEANPTGGNRQNNEHAPQAAAGPAAWLPALRIGGTIVLILLIIAAPLVSLAIVKLARRRVRRQSPSSAGRIASGWDELVDTAVDLGLPAPGVRSRVEAAALYSAASRASDSTTLRTLAHGADEAVFGAFDPTPDEADEFWAQLDEQRTRLAAAFPRWKRLLALISLRSFRNRGGDR